MNTSFIQAFRLMSDVEAYHMCTQRMVCYNIFSHPQLSERERQLWLWLFGQCSPGVELSCYISYQQISQALGYSTQAVHRALFRLRIMGFLASTSVETVEADWLSKQKVAYLQSQIF